MNTMLCSTYHNFKIQQQLSKLNKKTPLPNRTNSKQSSYYIPVLALIFNQHFKFYWDHIILTYTHSTTNSAFHFRQSILTHATKLFIIESHNWARIEYGKKKVIPSNLLETFNLWRHLLPWISTIYIFRSLLRPLCHQNIMIIV